MKKTKILSLSILLVFLSLNAQKESNSKQPSFEVNIGRSFAGTGDTWGYQFGFTYTEVITKKLNWFVGLEGSLHDEEGDVLIFDDPNGNTINSTLYDVTGGIQLLGGVRYNFIQNTHHNLGLSLGGVFRYQASSVNDYIETIFPILTDYPVPVRVIINETKQRTYSPGGVFKVQYNYKFNNKYLLGLTAGIQNDTNEDIISFFTLGFGFML